jgi:succinyl-diaminopimelate desuccinylase
MSVDIVKLTQDLVRIDTSKESIDAATYLQAYLENHGITARLDEYKEGHANIEATLGPKKGPSIIISGHLDTVPVGDPAKWKINPFSGEIVDGELWGRGSVDMKGGVAGLIGAMIDLIPNETELNHQIVLAATAEEETGLQGAKDLTSKGIMKDASHLLIAEPTDLGVAIMEKGILWIEILSRGKQAHASRPDLGVNAIEELAKIIPSISTVLPDHELPEVGRSTLSSGVIKGGVTPNVVPELASLICDIRTTPGIKNQEIIDALAVLLKEKSDDRVSFRSEVMVSDNAVRSPTNELGNALANQVEKYTNTRPKLGGTYYATDGAAFMAAKEVSFAIFGPGSTELLHQTNERLDLVQLELAQKITRDTILSITSE